MTSRPALVMLAAGMAKRYGGCKPLAPVGPRGEAVIDLTAGDALAGGFGRVVLVIGPATGPAITYHVQRCWPEWVEVSFADQPVPLGTAHAVLCARDSVGLEQPFAVVNADDLYGAESFSLLAKSLLNRREHALVAFRLRDTIVTADPVTRGTCVSDPTGHLAGITERRRIAMQPDGSFVAADGLDPAEIDGDLPVSVNLWGFQPSVWQMIEKAVTAAQPDREANGIAREAAAAARQALQNGEVLLPEVIGDALASGRAVGDPVVLLEGHGRCIGVTHATDLPVVRAEVASMVARGLRPESPWTESKPP